MLTRSAEYAMRALSYLAQQPGKGRSLRSRQIAAELEMPAPFLAKILRQLAEADILSSTRGRTGGFQLARDPAEISLESIVGVFQTLPDEGRCPLGFSDCANRAGCPMHQDWAAIQSTTRQLLRRTSLAEVAHRSAQVSSRDGDNPTSARSRPDREQSSNHRGREPACGARR